MDSNQIRDRFIRFYEERGHLRVPSASLVPFGDPTLLFTGAGMVPFKPYFMGLAEPPAQRLVTVQKVFRTTDIEAVGDYNHLTFFEMLGNFSIGDYFKKEAIGWAWELLTGPFGLDPERLWISIFLTDDEAYGHWRAIGVPDARIRRYGEEHNYWFSGDIGPCGPNSEIFVDRGPRPGCAYCAKGECIPNLEPDCGRFNEVWNLVFMTLYQAEDGTRTPLPRKNIDTGSGLERVACVLQSKETVYETDVFAPVIERIEQIAITHYGVGNDERDRAMRIIAEHTRAAVFLLADGVTPANEGRGYVLRRLIRRATHFGRTLVGNKYFLDPVGRAVIERMSAAYPGLLEAAPHILSVLSAEEERFARTLFKGRRLVDEIAEFGRLVSSTLNTAAVDAKARVNWASREVPLARMFQSSLFNEAVAESILQDIANALPQRPWLADPVQLLHASELRVKLTGRALFIFWDTYGFPPDLTVEVAAASGIEVADDAFAGFGRELEAQRERGRAAAKFEYEAARVAAYSELAARAGVGGAAGGQRSEVGGGAARGGTRGKKRRRGEACGGVGVRGV
jgi:alanyl-tRNA synthetase